MNFRIVMKQQSLGVLGVVVLLGYVVLYGGVSVHPNMKIKEITNHMVEDNKRHKIYSTKAIV